MTITNYSIKKKILAALLICGALSAWPMYTVFVPRIQKKLMLFNEQPTQEQIQNTITEIAQTSTVADTLAQELNAEHDRLLAALQNEFPMAQEWADTLELLEQLKAEDTLLCDNPEVKNVDNDHEIVKKARALLAEYGINPSKVYVYSVNEPLSGSFASAGQGYDGTVIHELKINLAKLPTLSKAIQDAIIRHEIMHLLHYDSLEHSFIISLFEENGIEQKIYRSNSTFRAYCSHKELRADLIAASDNIETAQAFQEDFLNRFKENPENYAKIYASHPSLKQRHAAMDILANYMQAEKQLVVA